MAGLTEVKKFLEGLFAPGEASTTDLLLGDCRAVVHRDDHTVTIVGRRVLQRFHKFGDANSFVAWLLRFYCEPKKVEIGVGRHYARAFQIDDPGQAELELEIRSEPVVIDLGGGTVKEGEARREVGAKPGAALTQAQFHRFVREHLSLIEGGTELLGELSKIDVAEGQKFTLQLEPNGLQSYVGGDRATSVTGTVPASFTVSTPFFEALVGGGTFNLLVLVTLSVTPSGAVQFQLDCPGLEMVARQAQAALAELIEEQLNADAPQADTWEQWIVGVAELNTAELELPGVMRSRPKEACPKD